LSSATVGNPDALARQLTGLDVQTVQDSGAPQGSKHLIFIDPVDSPAHTAILLLKAALHRGLRTIIYTQSRKMAELIAVWAGSQAGRYADKISAYRAGYLPQERRAIEAKLASGELLAVVSTSALELGIDIGDLDLCVLVGYPGSVVSTWQRGGRVGRSGQSSAMILVAGSDALDQYFMRNPNDFLARRPEAAVVNPYNPEVLAQQMVCAAAEMPLRTTDPYLADRQLQEGIKTLEEKSQLLRSEDGRTLYAARKAPHRDVNLRGTGSSFSIVEKGTGHNIGDIDIIRAFKETHEGAIYLHKGRTYRVERLDIGAQTIQAIRAAVDYYTRVRSHKETEILETFAQKTFGQTTVSYGRLKVTEQISGYEKRRISTKERLWIVQLQLPPLIFETEGFWIQIPERTQEASESKQLHFMGGIHAIEHAAIGVCPLVVMADRNDLGGISAPFHHQVNRAAIFVYDGIPGGAGLSRQAYEQVVRVFDYTHKAIESCPCENGCPSCVHSPKCGSGNRPIDKAAALFILKHLKRDNTKSKEQQKVHLSIAGASDCRSVPMPEKAGKETRAGIRQPTSRLSGPMMRRQKHRLSRRAAGMPQPAIRRPETLIAEVSSPYRQDRTPGHHYGVFDLETQRSAQEVGGWHRADQMRISCAVLYDSQTDTFHEYLESDIPAFIKHLKRLEKVVGFNILRFDYRVLSGYSSFDFYALNNLDLLDHVHQRLGYRLSLGHLAQTTLGYPKSADGLQALRWWKEKKIRLIVDYCREDVRITRDLFLSGKKDGYLLFTNKAGHTVRLPVDW
jgi:DEAD/DEAH box helicase domain-containing protein